jgi:acyl-ACP thioesterase
VSSFTPAATISSPAGGRVHRGVRIVRLDEVGVDGRLRLDAVARYAQDIASDDLRDAGVDRVWTWVVRRTTIIVGRRPRYDQTIGLATWCSGTGSAWAERRTTINIEGDPAIEVSALWVCLDPERGRPVPLDDRFIDLYGASTAGRRVGGRLVHPGMNTGTRSQAQSRRWPLRRSDFDPLGHVNNAITWTLVEDEVAERAPTTRLTAAEVEYRAPVTPGADLRVWSATDAAGGLGIWVDAGDEIVCSSAMVTFRGVDGDGALTLRFR